MINKPSSRIARFSRQNRTDISFLCSSQWERKREKEKFLFFSLRLRSFIAPISNTKRTLTQTSRMRVQRGSINRHVVSLRTRIRAPVNYYVPSLPSRFILPRLHPRCTTSSHFYRHAFMFRGKWHVNSNAILFKGQLTPCVVPLFRLLTSFRIRNDFSRELKGFDGKKLLEKGEKHFDISCFEFNKYRWIYR